MENSDLKDFDVQDQKLIKEFLKAESLTLDEIEISDDEIFETYALRIELGSNTEYYLIPDDSNLDKEALEFMKDDHSEYPYFYTEGIKSGDINPVQTSFIDWIEQIIQYDGWISVIGSYDGGYNELSNNAVYFRRN